MNHTLVNFLLGWCCFCWLWTSVEVIWIKKVYDDLDNSKRWNLVALLYIVISPLTMTLEIFRKILDFRK